MRTSGSKSTRPSRDRIVPIDRDARPGRLGGATVAFGAPGPKIDVAKFLEATRPDTSISGGEAGADPGDPAPLAAPVAAPVAVPVTAPLAAAPVATPSTGTARQTIAFSDGTKVSFVAVHDLLELQND